MSADPIADLIAVLDAHFRCLKSPRPRMRRQLAGGGLARCRALLEGMVLIHGAQREDVIGVLARSLLETWMVSLYVLYKGKDLDDDSVLVELGKDYATWTTKMATKVGGWAEGAKGDEAVAEWREEVQHQEEQARAEGKSPNTPNRLNYEAIARDLGPLLEEVDGPASGILAIYDSVYRGESIYSVHGGLGTLWQYVRTSDNDQEDAVIERPGSKFPGTVKMAALLTAYLGIHVFRAFSVPVEPSIAEVYTRIMGLPLE